MKPAKSEHAWQFSNFTCNLKKMSKIEKKVEHIHNDMIQGNKSMIKVMIGAAGTVVAGLLSTIVVILINVQ